MIEEDTETERAALKKQDQAYLWSVELYVQDTPQDDPTTYKQAIKGDDLETWKEAMSEEIKSLKEMGT